MSVIEYIYIFWSSYIYIHTYIYIWICMCIFMYVYIYVYIYIYIYLNKGADSTWNRALSCSETVRRKSALTWNRTWTWKKCGILKLERSAHFRFLVWRFKRLAFGPGRVLPRSQGKRTIDLGHIWSHRWWEMVPDTHLQKIHGLMGGEKWSQQLSKCRYLSTDLSTRLIDHGRYRRLIRIHLLENTVDIDGRCWFTYGELRSIVDGRLKIEIILWLISSTTPVSPFEIIFRALLIAQCPYRFSSFLDLRNGSSRFRLFARDFRRFRFFLSGSACFSKVAPPGNLQSWVKYDGKFASFGKEFRWTKLSVVERVTVHVCSFLFNRLFVYLRMRIATSKTTIIKQNKQIILLQNNIHMSEVHCESAVRFGQALPGNLITAHHLYACLL